MLLFRAHERLHSQFHPQISATLSLNCHKAAKVVETRVHGGQCFGGFSGGNVRERTNFGRRPEVFSWWPYYRLN